MTGVLRRVAAGLVALGVLTGTAGTASADTTPGVTTGVVFTTPSGTQEQQNAIETKLAKLINGAANGSTIQVALYFLRDGAIVDALIKAHQERDVRVKVILDERNTWEPPRDMELLPGQTRVRNHGMEKLAAALGIERNASSFLHVCTEDGACIGKLNSPKNHNKFYLFSNTLGEKNVVVQASGNISLYTRLTNFNEAVTFTRNPGLYADYQAYFKDLTAMNKTDNYYRTALAGPVKAFHFPRRGSTPWEASTDDVYQILNHVTCKGNKTVGTSDHRTIIRVNLFELNRADVAQRLYDLDAKGCYVEVIYTAVGKEAEKILTTPAGKYHGPVLRCSKFTYPAGEDEDGEPVMQGAYTHQKYSLIEGVYYGIPDKKIILTGSHNYTYSALRENDETLLRIDSPTLYNAYRSAFGRLKSEMAEHDSAPLVACRRPADDARARSYLPRRAEQELERELQDEYED